MMPRTKLGEVIFNIQDKLENDLYRLSDFSNEVEDIIDMKDL